MIIRLLIAAVVSMAGITGTPTDYIDPYEVSSLEPLPTERIYFQETGHYLEAPLLQFWAEYGGVPVFGFPIAPAIEEDGKVVQYFERAVLEFHPDNPEGWQTLPRRLGSVYTLLTFVPLKPTPPAGETGDAFYFEETGYSIDALFLDFWNEQGGVTVFGLPISNLFEQNDRTVQYFERAILEFHPENPEGWQVMPARLGLEAARAHGVDLTPVKYDGHTPIYQPHLVDQMVSGSEELIVYLTFDDGPHAEWTPLILEILERHNATATFFVLGLNAGHYPELVDEIAAAGHALANHGYDHTSMAGMPFAEFDRQVRSTEQAVPYRMVPCLRPPYGAMDVNTRAFAAQMGYEISLWDVDTRDWERPGSGLIADRVLQQINPGDVVLFHDGGGDRSQTAAALETILEQLTERGYQFAPMCQ